MKSKAMEMQRRRELNLGAEVVCVATCGCEPIFVEKSEVDDFYRGVALVGKLSLFVSLILLSILLAA